jgi:hypothetical protein
VPVTLRHPGVSGSEIITLDIVPVPKSPIRLGHRIRLINQHALQTDGQLH